MYGCPVILMFLVKFHPDDLLIRENEVLKSPAVNELMLIRV